MIAKVISCNTTYGESHSTFYEGYHGDYDFSHLSISYYPFRGTVSQGYFLGNVICFFEYLYQGRAIH